MDNKTNKSLKFFNIDNENILLKYYRHFDDKFVYSKTYDRIFLCVGNINYNNKEGEDNIPTILVDVDGQMNDFEVLKAENVYQVFSIPNGFSYTEYCKNL